MAEGILFVNSLDQIGIKYYWRDRGNKYWTVLQTWIYRLLPSWKLIYL